MSIRITPHDLRALGLALIALRAQAARIEGRGYSVK